MTEASPVHVAHVNVDAVLNSGAAHSGGVRADIQALRGYAIGLVVLHHAALWPGLKAGFLGVDVFFVVSGYLITGMVSGQLKQGEFRFGEFYLRRAKRLLPAAYVVFLACSLSAVFILTAPELRDYAKSLVGAVGLFANVTLWMQTGYFESAAQFKPLMHAWSLSLEEQYYLLLPMCLALLPVRFWPKAALAVVLLSLALCLGLGAIKPGATFFLLPTRAWELGLGSLGVLWPGLSRAKFCSGLFWPAVIALLLLPLVPLGGTHPGWDAVAICVATLVILLRCHPSAASSIVARPLVFVGDISYSLYLVHWPLFSFAANAWVSPTPAVVRLVLMVISLGLAMLLNRCVEVPMRRATLAVGWRQATIFVAGSVVVAVSGMVAWKVDAIADSHDYVYDRRANYGLDVECEYADVFIPSSKCRSGENPKVLVWGDSNAMHLVAGLVGAKGIELEQATRSVCGPLLGIAPVEASGPYDERWARGCLTFNDDVLAHVARSDSIKTVVLASAFGAYLDGNSFIVRAVDSKGSETITRAADDPERVYAALVGTITQLRSLGVRVVVVAPPPSVKGIDAARCLELRATGKLCFGADYSDCRISRARYQNDRAAVLSLLARLKTDAFAPVLSFDEDLCGGDTCIVELDGVGIYRDPGHFSYAGSEYLGRKLGLVDRILNVAR